MKYLIDTDLLIDFLHARRNAVDILKPLFKEGVALSTVTLAEFWYGAYFGPYEERERNALSQFLAVTIMTLFPVNERIAEYYGEIQASLTKRGVKGNGFDVLIAATAMAHGLTLVTGNAKDSKKIEGLKRCINNILLQ